MPTLIAASVSRTCLGDGAETFRALLRGACGARPLIGYPASALNVAMAYRIGDGARPRAAGLLAGCVAEAMDRARAHAGVDPDRHRVVALIATGLRELGAVEGWAVDGGDVRPQELHFGPALRATAPGLEHSMVVVNACSAAGHALALGQDLIELGEADAVVVAAVDVMSESMLAMIGRFTEHTADRVRPFDISRGGALLGEGAAAAVLVRAGLPARRAPLARVLATGLSCDAAHETAPDPQGIRRAVDDAITRSGRSPQDVDLVLAHGTGTGLNDPVEAVVLREVLGEGDSAALVTAVKGAVGHTSGVSALTSLDVGLRALATGLVPAVVGLREPIPETHGLQLVRDHPRRADPRLLQVQAFGFGGVNAVALVEAVTPDGRRS